MRSCGSEKDFYTTVFARGLAVSPATGHGDIIRSREIMPSP
jgi:hypothetical protein